MLASRAGRSLSCLCPLFGLRRSNTAASARTPAQVMRVIQKSHLLDHGFGSDFGRAAETIAATSPRPAAFPSRAILKAENSALRHTLYAEQGY